MTKSREERVFYARATGAGFWTEADDQKIKEMRSRGIKLDAIAQELNVSRSQLEWHMRYEGWDNFPKRLLPEDQISAMSQLYRKGCSFAMIGRVYDLSAWQVAYALRKYGVVAASNTKEKK